MEKEKRLIDADAFQFEPVDNTMNGVQFMGRSTGKTLQMVKYCLRAMIENAPTVEAVEVVHGRWLESEGTVCSMCNKHFFQDGPWVVANYKANYCPNCGAKMDGGNEDGNGR